MKTIRIPTTGNPHFDLLDLLAFCTAYQSRQWVTWKVDWALVDLRLEARPDENLVYDCYEAIVKAPNYQAQTTLAKLMDCATLVIQTENGFFMAVRPDVQKVPKLTTLNALIRVSDLIIHAFDWAFWEVTTSNEDLLLTIASKFYHVEWYDRMMEGSTSFPYD